MLKRLLLMSCLCLAVSAQAQEYPDRTSMSVAYADLDLSTAPGQRRFEARLRAALDKVCENGGFSLFEAMAKRHCVEAARSVAAPQAAEALARANKVHLASK